MTRTATAAEVRKLHKDQGREVRIFRDGRVEYRDEGGSMWLEGRWVEEYRVDAECGVVCP